MAEASVKHCPDCRGDLEPIKLLARTPLLEGALSFPQYVESDGAVVRYAAADAKRSDTGNWTYRVAGTVKATLCSSCHRIFLHGEPVPK